MNCSSIAAVVTGGASGLGAACIKHLAEKGAKVAIWDTDEGKGTALADDIGANAAFCPVDITDSDSILQALERTLGRFGSIQVVVNCAGIAPPARVVGKNGPMDIELFTRVVGINLIGTMNVIRLIAPHMIKNLPGRDGERGVIVNTASIAAFEGQIGQAGYSSSKAGVVGLTLPLAREFADQGIRVVAVAPGLFDTPMMAGLPEKVRVQMARIVPMPRRLGHPGEFASLVEHIITNAMLNGSTIRIDGALRMGA